MGRINWDYAKRVGFFSQYPDVLSEFCGGDRVIAAICHLVADFKEHAGLYRSVNVAPTLLKRPARAVEYFSLLPLLSGGLSISGRCEMLMRVAAYVCIHI
ncbi:hypothetical protein GF415_01165 [Candidatus Micrarchaeota archaeon]|nr:hypothetical protein [Candidatus Micrarchaeota archaeon]